MTKVDEIQFRRIMQKTGASPDVLQAKIRQNGHELGFDISVFKEQKPRTNFMQRLSDSVNPKESVGKAHEAIRSSVAGEQSPISGGLQIAGAAISSVGEVGMNVAKMGTTENFRKRLGGAFAQAVQDDPIMGRAFQALGKVMERVDQIQDPELRENIQALGTISSILPLGNIASVKNLTKLSKVTTPAVELAEKFVSTPVKTTGKILGGATKFATKQITGFSDDTVNYIMKNTDFDPNISPEVLRGNVGKQFSDVLDDFQKAESGQLPEYGVIRADTANKVVFPLKKDPLINTLESKGFQVIPQQTEGGVKFTIRKTASSRVPLSKNEITRLEEVLDLGSSKRVLSNDEFLNIRGELTKLSKFDSTGEVTKDLRSLAREMREQWNTSGRRQISGLEGIDKNFTDLENTIDEFAGDFVKFDDAGQGRMLSDSGYKKLLNLAGKGKERELARLKKYIPDIEDKLKFIRAVEDVKLAGGQKTGTYIRAALAGTTGQLIGGPVGIIFGIMASSPAVSIPLLKAYGRLSGIADDVIKSIKNKFSTGVKLSPQESQVFSDAVEHYATVEAASQNPIIP